MKTKIRAIVEAHNPFLQTLESFNELSMWTLTVMGILNPNDHKYLHQTMRENGIDVDKLFNSRDRIISKELHDLEMRKYEKKVDKWNEENK